MSLFSSVGGIDNLGGSGGAALMGHPHGAVGPTHDCGVGGHDPSDNDESVVTVVRAAWKSGG